MLGVDTLNPDETPIGSEGTPGVGFKVHEVVLGSGRVIAENLTNLGALCPAASPGKTWIVSLMPLKLQGCDGSPVRAYAQEQETNKR